MQAVILMAGKSTRTHPLTLTRPKALLPIANKPLIQHIFENLKGRVDEIILVVGYRKEMIQEHFGDEFEGMKLTYVEQKEQLGTAHAVLSAKGIAKNRFIVMNGDDIYHKDNIVDVLDSDYSLLVEKVKDPSRFGVWIIDQNKVRGFVEKPKKFVSDVANCGLYVLDERIFSEIEKLEKSERGEYELNEAVNSLAKYQDIYCAESNGKWSPIGYPWNLLNANGCILKELQSSVIEGKVEPNTTILGNVFIGKGTVVKNGTYIEGPTVIGENCYIGPNAYIRPNTSIGNNCRIRGEVVDSIIMDNTTAKHSCYIGHSVIGENCNIGAGTVTADYRHDEKYHVTVINGRKVDTGLRKLGAFIGDNVKTGINTSIYPGRKIWHGKCTLPGEIVKKDIE